MKPLLQINLALCCILGVGLAATILATGALLQAQAEEQALDRARLLMDKASAVRSFTADQIEPLLRTQMKTTFLPQAIPAFSATEVLAALRKTYPGFTYKEATLNPTNPRDRAEDWEAEIVERFRHSDELAEYIGRHETAQAASLVLARPLRVDDASCLQCHGSAEGAPQPLIARYGAAHGFGWQLHEVVGVQLVSVPLAAPRQAAREAGHRLVAIYVASFAGVILVVDLMFWLLAVRPRARKRPAG